MRSLLLALALALGLGVAPAAAAEGDEAYPGLEADRARVRDLYRDGDFVGAGRVVVRMIEHCDRHHCDRAFRVSLWRNLGRIRARVHDGPGARAAEARAAAIEAGEATGTDREHLATAGMALALDCSPAREVRGGHPIPLVCRRVGAPPNDGSIDWHDRYALPPLYAEARTSPDRPWSRLTSHPKASLVWALAPCELVAGADALEVRWIAEDGEGPTVVAELALALRPDGPVAAFEGNEAPAACDAPSVVGTVPVGDGLPTLRVVPLEGRAPELATPPPGCGRCALDARPSSGGGAAWALVAGLVLLRRRRRRARRFAPRARPV